MDGYEIQNQDILFDFIAKYISLTEEEKKSDPFFNTSTK